jgi:hypothetical protein
MVRGLFRGGSRNCWWGGDGPCIQTSALPKKIFGGLFLLGCKLVEIKPAVVLACKFVNFTALSSQYQDFTRPCCLNPSPMLRFFF